MTDAKVDPAIIEECDRLVARGLFDPRVPVIIEHVTPATVGGEGEPRAQLSRLEQQIHELQQGIVERLRELGVHGTPQRLVLANAVVAELTRSQVIAISTHADVKRVQLSRQQQVTC